MTARVGLHRDQAPYELYWHLQSMGTLLCLDEYITWEFQAADGAGQQQTPRILMQGALHAGSSSQQSDYQQPVH